MGWFAGPGCQPRRYRVTARGPAAQVPAGLPGNTTPLLACFLIRVLGVRYDLNARRPRNQRNAPAGAGRTKAEVPVAVPGAS